MSALIPTNIVHANRRILTGCCLGGLTFSWILIHGAERYLQWLNALVGNDPSHVYTQGVSLFLMVASLMVLGLGIFSGWMGTIAYQAFRTGSYPPVQSMVLRDTEVLGGWRAMVKAWTALLLSLLASLTAIVLALGLYSFFAIASS